MPIIRLDLRTIRAELVELRCFEENPYDYESRPLALAEIRALLKEAEAGRYAATGTERDLEMLDRKLEPVLQLGEAQQEALSQRQIELVQAGRRLFQWLDGSAGWLTQRLAAAMGEEVVLAIATAQGLANLPWELLHDGTGFLVQRQPAVVPVRWLASEAVIQLTPVSQPRNRALNLLLMATSPLDVKPVLNYEQEEAQILTATTRFGIGLTVEESGCLEELRELVASQPCDRATNPPEAAFDGVHLTGHATIQDGQPRFITETATGDAYYASAAEIARALGNPLPPLVWLSGCRTGQSSNQGAVPSTAEELLQYGATAVLGWGQNVLDTDATKAAAALYGSLSRSDGLIAAVRETYRALIKQKARDWHLLRLYVGKTLPGALVTPAQTRGRKPAPKASMATEFLDPVTRQIRVPRRESFVGRRRQLQGCIRALTASPDYLAVLIHGMGGLGKSSLAARLCDRLTQFQRRVWQGRIDPQSLGRELAEMLDDPELRQTLQNPDEELKFRLRRVFGRLAERGEPPFLLVLDDFEQNLKPAGESYCLLTPAQEVLEALVFAIQQTGSGHRLLLTSRYEFESDYGDLIYKQPLDGLQGADLQKKCEQLVLLKPQPQSVTPFTAESLTPEETLAAQAKLLADGNPRLLETLDEQLRQPHSDAAAELAQLIADPTPLRQKVLEDRLLHQISAPLETMLARGLVFELPVPPDAFATVTEGEGHLAQAIGLGLLEVSPDQTVRVPRILQRHLPDESEAIAGAAAQALYGCWWPNCDEAQALEVHRLALLAPKPKIAAELAAALGHRWANQSRFREAVALGQTTLAIAPDYRLYHSLARSQEPLGQVQQALANYQQALAICPEADKQERAAILHNSAGIYRQQGQVQQALDLYQESLSLKESIGDVQGKAATLHAMANIYTQQGQVQQALDLYQESLTLKESIGNVRGKAATLHAMAYIYSQQGQVQQALDLYQESLTLKESIGDVQGKAATLNQLAAIEFERGETANALALLQQSAQALAQANAYLDLFTVLGNLGAADAQQAQVYLAQALWLGLRIQLPLPGLIALLKFFYNAVPQADPLEALLATTALYLCQTQSQNHPELEQLQTTSVNMLANAAQTQGATISSMEDLTAWMAQQQLNDPSLFLPQLDRRLIEIIGDGWLFDPKQIGRC